MVSSNALVAMFASLPQNPHHAAVSLAEAGVPVFPCAPGRKGPLVKDGGGFLGATTDLRQVEAWWRRSPNANIAIPTGAASGVVVVDVDVHNVDGFEAFGRARRAGLLPPPLAVVRTPSGGAHLYYSAAPGVEQRNWQAAKAGIDLRGDGGYIVIPPSRVRVNGTLRGYEVRHIRRDATVPVDSVRLREFLDPRPAELRPRPGTGRSFGSVTVERIAAWAAGLVEGERNRGLFWAACRLAEADVPIDDALDALGAAEQADFGQREITRTVHSAYRAVGVNGTRPTAEGQGFERRSPPVRSPMARGLS